MKLNKINKKACFLFLGAAALTVGCTKLNENLNQSFVFGGAGSAANPAGILVQSYNDLVNPFTNQDEVFSLMENTSDESLVPTRAGDWDDNGVWRVLHAHAWDATHGQSSTVFTNLGQLESDATTVLASSPSTEQAAEATFLRSLAQYYFLNLYGQVPYRTIPNYNTVNAAPVMTPAQAIDTLVTNLTGIISTLPSSNTPYQANQDAARFLLMKVLLNKQWFLNPSAPAAASASDMQQVYSLGQAILGSVALPSTTGGKYPLTASYFDNFGPNNGGFGGPNTGGKSTEMIFAYQNNGTATNPNGTNNADVDARWMMGLHYNSYDSPASVYGSAGWNGFSTIADVYNAFDASDIRLGNVPYPTANSKGVSPISGLNVGFCEGQQYNEKGNPIYDRKGNLLVFAPTVANIETNVKTLEGDGIRVMKYYPDYAHYTSTVSNQLVFFRAADVWLMMAEADLNGASGGASDALAIVNALHTVRNAPVLASLSLVNKSNLYDGTTLLEERQKEMYWESWRREDMIRMGVFLNAWNLKPADAGTKYLLFPIPATQLIVNPNLKQNPGY